MVKMFRASIRSICFISLALILLFISVSALAQGAPELRAEEYEIFSEVIRKTAVLSESRNVVVSDTTSRDAFFVFDVSKEVQRKLNKLQKSTLESFRKANKAEGKLRQEFADDLVVHLIPWSDSVNSLGRLSGDKDAATKYAAEYRLTFSRVGFNKEMTQALVHVDYRHNEMRKYAFGSYFLFSRQNDGAWEVVNIVRSWVY
ncbi:MAG: hypothetical protein KF762_03475 [Acidobacteria bacterium]|nr:hypothetical protein [Acidobacteriota bacterium]